MELKQWTIAQSSQPFGLDLYRAFYVTSDSGTFKLRHLILPAWLTEKRREYLVPGYTGSATANRIGVDDKLRELFSDNEVREIRACFEPRYEVLTLPVFGLSSDPCSVWRAPRKLPRF